MLTIARKHPDDIRTVPIFRDLADDRAEVLEKIRAGKYPPELYLGCYYAETRPRYDDPRGGQSPATGSDDSCRFGTRDNVITKLREEILLNYADAIETIVKNGDYASRELRDLESVDRARVASYFRRTRARNRRDPTCGPHRELPAFCHLDEHAHE